MNGSKNSLAQKLEELKNTLDEKSSLPLDAKKVEEFLNNFVDLGEEVQTLINEIKQRQEINSVEFKKVLKRLIEIINGKRQSELNALLEQKQQEIFDAIETIKSQLSNLETEIKQTSLQAKRQTSLQQATQNSLEASRGKEKIDSLLASVEKEVKGKKVLRIFDAEKIFEKYKKIILKEVKGEKLSWLEKIAKWGYTLALSFVAGDLLSKLNESIASLGEVVSEKKMDLSPKQIETYKETLGEKMFELFLPVMPAGLSTEEKKEKWRKAWEKIGEKYSQVWMKSIDPHNPEMITPDKILEVLIGSGAMSLYVIWVLLQEGLISISQVGLEALKEGGQYVYHLAIKGWGLALGIPGLVLGKVTVDDLKELLDMDSDSDKLVYIYTRRLMQGWIGEMAKVAVSLPFSLLNKGATFKDAAERLKVMWSAFSSQEQKLLTLLSKIENQLNLGGGTEVYKSLIATTKEGINIYTAAQYAKTPQEFVKNLAQLLGEGEHLPAGWEGMSLEELTQQLRAKNSTVGEILGSIEKKPADSFWKKVEVYMKDDISSPLKKTSLLFSQNLPESLKRKMGLNRKTIQFEDGLRKMGGMFDNMGNLIRFKEASSLNPLVKFKRAINVVEQSGKSAVVVDLKILSDSGAEWRRLIREAPILVREIFGGLPLILLAGAEVSECHSINDCGDAVKNFLYDVTPIVGPIHFFVAKTDEFWKGDISFEEWMKSNFVTLGWGGLDAVFLWRVGLWKGVLQPIEALSSLGRMSWGTARFGWDSLSLVAKRIKSALPEALNEAKRVKAKWLMGTAIAIILGWEGYEAVKKFFENGKISNFIEEFVEKCGGEGGEGNEDSLNGCSHWVSERFAEGDAKEKEMISQALISLTFGVPPTAVNVKKSKANTLEVIFDRSYKNQQGVNPFFEVKESEEGKEELIITGAGIKVVEFVESLWGIPVEKVLG